MPFTIHRRAILLGAAAAAATACAPVRPNDPDEAAEIAALAAAIAGLSDTVDPAEAQRVAAVFYRETAVLKAEYDITTGPLVHNALVNHGVKARGLCNHWAQDLQRRLIAERLRTLDPLHAISPPTPWRIIHHSAVIAPRGGAIRDGIILDPWRTGGTPFWVGVRDDRRYNWRPAVEVMEAMVAARRAAAPAK